ncbi:MAG: tripartite tricarboxylate transporter substrate binding protein [Burkholderiales bacterium]
MATSASRRKIISAGAAAAGIAAIGLPLRSSGQAFPTHDIKLYVPLSPGSSVDTLTRAFSNEFGKALGQPILVENKPGAEGQIASGLTAKAPPDGYTLMVAYPGHALNVSLYPNLPYDTLKDFTPIGLIAQNVNVLVVLPTSPIKSVPDLIAQAKANPGKLNYGNAGGTSGGSGDIFKLMTGLDMAVITYKGAAEAQNDLLGGRIDFMFTALSTAKPLVQSGKLRALAVTGTKRHPDVPDLPPVADFVPGFETTGWYGLAGPANMPAPIVDKLNKALFEALASPDVRARLTALGFDPAPPNTPAQFDAFIRAEIKKWGQVLKPRV